MTNKPDIYFIYGATASGKTAKSLEIAKKRESIIINADAMQVYKDLPILTAQPSFEEKQQVPHKLFEIFDPSERSSVGRWSKLARTEIEKVVKENKTPIIVGGTGMYFGSLLGKLAEIPSIPKEIRGQTTKLYDEVGHDEFRKILFKKDEISANKIAKNDRQRLIRAYEVICHTGKSLSDWQKEGESFSLENKYNINKILINLDREELYSRCDKRFLQMIEKGAIEEVKSLIERNLDPTLPAMKILGVPELSSYLKGEITLDKAIEKAKQSTRNFAKRQITWFKNQV